MYAFRLFGFPNYETTLETIRSTIPLIMNKYPMTSSFRTLEAFLMKLGLV